MITPHAATAKAIRQELKALGIKASVTSKRFSMGNAVDINVKDAAPETMEVLEKIARKYEYGTFNGMTDGYECDNKNDSIPQVKYTSANNGMSDAMIDAVWAFMRAHYDACLLLPEKYEEAKNIYTTLYPERDGYVRQLVWQEFCRSNTAWNQKQRKAV